MNDLAVDVHGSTRAFGGRSRLVPLGLLVAVMGGWSVPEATALVTQDPTTICEIDESTIVGTPGDDLLVGTDMAEVIVGLGGDDIIRGRGNADKLCGGPGHDVVSGGRGKDHVEGGQGNDRLIGGSAEDHLSYRFAPGPVTVKMGAGSVLGVGRDRVTSFYYIFGSIYADWIHGSRNQEVIFAGHGADWVHGGGGNDGITDGYHRSESEPDDDVLIAGRDGANLYANRGDDRLYAGHDGAVSYLVGRSGDDRLVGDRGRQTLIGGSGSDTLIGGAGPDKLIVRRGTLFTRATDELVRAGAGNDYVESSIAASDEQPYLGRVRLFLGRGDDRVDADVFDHLAIRGGIGTDVVRFHSVLDLVVDFVAGTVSAPIPGDTANGIVYGF